MWFQPKIHLFQGMLANINDRIQQLQEIVSSFSVDLKMCEMVNDYDNDNG